MNLPPCEVCGRTAVATVVDIADITTFADHYKHYRPHSPHHFCAAHVRESITYSANTPAPQNGSTPIRFTTRNQGLVRLVPLGGDLYMLQEVKMHLPDQPRGRKRPDCWQPHECEVCGEPATVMVADTLDVTTPDDRAQRVMPLPPIHYYCEQHQRDSVQVKASEISASTIG